MMLNNGRIALRAMTLQDMNLPAAYENASSDSQRWSALSPQHLGVTPPPIAFGFGPNEGAGELINTRM